jgi:hypothetical protein
MAAIAPYLDHLGAAASLERLAAEITEWTGS